MTLISRRKTGLLLTLLVCVLSQPKDWQSKILSNDWLYSFTQESGMYSPAVGNGYMGTIVFSDSVFVSGVYNGNMTDERNPSHRARVPSPLNISVVTIDGNKPDKADCALDMEAGRYLERYNGVVEQIIYAHRKRPHLLVHELRSVKGKHVVCIRSNPGAASSDVNFTAAIKKDLYKGYEGWTYLTEWPATPRRKLVVVTWEPPNANPSKLGELSSWQHCVTLDQTEKSLFFYSVVMDDAKVEDAEKLYKEIVDTDSAVIAKEHVEAWKELRHNGASIHITGYTELAQAVNSSVYELLISMREDRPWSNSPGGLETNGYNGHMFWDFETWMYPSLLAMYPKLARSGLQYRLDHIEGARKKARDNGYKGAMWPWESAYTGDETTPTFANTGKMEHHISGDIIFAARQYDYLHRDKALRDSAWCPLALETAEYWASRVEKDAKGYYHILHVIPPDEYAENVSDSIYTNDIARISLEYAVECKANPLWTEIAEHMFIEYDPVRDWHPEYVGYKRGQMVKQADTTLVAFPMERPYNKSTLRNDLEYYERFTDREGPAMTWSMFFIDSIDLARNDEEIWMATHKYFYKSFLINMKGPFFSWLEAPENGCGHFATGAGGFLQGLIYGYGGLRVYYDKKNPKILARLKPVSPTEPIKKFEIRGINLLGGQMRLDIMFDGRDTYVRTLQSGYYLESKVAGKFDLTAGSWVQVPSNIGVKDPDGLYVVSGGRFLKMGGIGLLLLVAIILIQPD